MRLRKVTLLILILTLGFLSCKKDDDNATEIIIIPPNDRTEQQVIDKALLLEYLDTHYYNASAFTDANTISTQDLVITQLEDGETVPVGSRLLSDPNVVETITITYADTTYDYYILRLNQGDGVDSPKFADSVFGTYEGFTLDGEVFDSQVNPEVFFDLSSVIVGWRKVFPQFNTAVGFAENGDGTVDYMNHGSGVMFLPSGLAYFNGTGPSGGITPYSPLIFKFDLYKMLENDQDGDGIPSYLEDRNGNEELLTFEGFADDDTDGDGTPDYFDSDDDGDGIPTINEDLDDDGDPTNDIGKNGIARYLDPEETDFIVK
ncbi:FKBP-type peptidyl-prolyl cis-trans isomerase [Flaviramulus aquimarinus]|uniref:peptidylprolyl isomerase n=1 Tax=Flaviramulus aquimarinus TaxID=1170456 RepID=A0ABP9FB15_9FLAO